MTAPARKLPALSCGKPRRTEIPSYPTLKGVARLSLERLREIYPRLPLTTTPERCENLEAIEARLFATPELEHEYIAWRSEDMLRSQGIAPDTPGALLWKHRINCGLTHAQFADHFGVLKRDIESMEQGNKTLHPKIRAILERLYPEEMGLGAITEQTGKSTDEPKQLFPVIALDWEEDEGPQIKAFREKYGITQERLAANWDISESMLSQIERSKKPLPKRIKSKLPRVA